MNILLDGRFLAYLLLIRVPQQSELPDGLVHDVADAPLAVQNVLSQMLLPPASDASREMLEAYLKLLAEAYQSTCALAKNLQVFVMPNDFAHKIRRNVGAQPPLSASSFEWCNGHERLTIDIIRSNCHPKLHMVCLEVCSKPMSSHLGAGWRRCGGDGSGGGSLQQYAGEIS